MKVLFTLFLFFSSLLSFALTLKCYQCDSSSSITCNYEIFSFTYDTVDCDNQLGGFLLNLVPKQCVKLIAKVKNGHEQVARGCLPSLGGACRAIAKTLGFFGRLSGSIEDIDCIPCDGDKCNADSKFVVFLFLGILLAIFAVLIFLVYKFLVCCCFANRTTHHRPLKREQTYVYQMGDIN